MFYTLVVSALVCLGFCLYIIHLRRQLALKLEEDKRQREINEDLYQTGRNLQKQNQMLNNELEVTQQEKIKTETELKGLRLAVDAQSNILKSLSAASEEMRQAATKQAEEAYQDRFEALAADYEGKEKEYQSKYDKAVLLMNKSLLAEKEKLEDLEAKQRAFIEAQRRAQEIKEHEDFYSLVLSGQDLSDIASLRDLQYRFSKKEVIDKMIWETYYKPAYDILMGKLFKSDKICGIYKITSRETSQAYIGQSVDIKERFRQHIKAGLSTNSPSNRLYREMYKQGPESFTFEILEQVPRDKLNERETYWIEFYKTKEIGLNSTKGGA